ncbi:MAG TPA: adenosylmethionine--8-amino-7-oxononanoate transaminase [Fluviicoccus sp.]|nr:adenosylmethionine--8-amino-7-oxononanoate transaminase [Fluviicoccus sp.]
MSSPSLMQRDLAVLWHPCTQMHDHETLPVIPVARAAGVWLTDTEGRRYIDAISSWWVNIWGHANPHINAALKEQLDTLEHVILAGFTHEPIVSLSEKLVALAPAGLSRCFYADNGSAAIEVALKMSMHCWRNRGETAKTRFVALSGSYHGETLGALSVTDIPLFSETYAPLLTPQLRVPSPDWTQAPEGVTPEQFARQQFAVMEELLKTRHAEISAVIVEPLVQGAAGMKMYHPVYLRLLREACSRYGVHLIADEIAVGFGRTGSFFACEQADITPDFLCLSKALTAGYLPMSVVLTTDEVYQTFYHRYEALKGFLHSHSFTGNPLAARAALASLELFALDPQRQQQAALAAVMAEELARLQGHDHIRQIRQTGLIGAFDMTQRGGLPFDWRERRGLKVFEAALRQGVLLRPIGNTVYFMPPYVMTADELRHVIRTAAGAVEEACAAPAAGHDNGFSLP